ncbi:MAG: type II secretion system protein GspG, partial [Smithellaceae bacterium]
IYSATFYFGFMKRGGVYDDLRVKMAQSNLTQLVQSIEFYKVQNGTYPVSLEALKDALPKESMVFINDPTDVHMGGESRNFYYKRIDENHYHLLGVGSDGKPFTNHDILPTIASVPQGKVGLIIKPLEEKSL